MKLVTHSFKAVFLFKTSLKTSFLGRTVKSVMVNVQLLIAIMLVVIQIELLRKMTLGIAGQFYAKDEGPNKIQDGGQNGMPVSLGLNMRVSLSGFCSVISRLYYHLYICPGPMGGECTCIADVWAINLQSMASTLRLIMDCDTFRKASMNTHQRRGQGPEDDRERKSHDISCSAHEVDQQKQVARETADERNRVQDGLPASKMTGVNFQVIPT